MANRFARIGLVAVILAAAVLIQDSSKLISPGPAKAEEDGELQVLDLSNLLLFSAIGLAGLVLVQASLVPGALPPLVRAALSQMANYMGGYLRREINDHAF